MHIDNTLDLHSFTTLCMLIVVKKNPGLPVFYTLQCIYHIYYSIQSMYNMIQESLETEKNYDTIVFDYMTTTRA